jgi:hypothetical protein
MDSIPAAFNSSVKLTVNWVKPRFVALCVHVDLEKLAPQALNPKLYTWNGVALPFPSVRAPSRETKIFPRPGFERVQLERLSVCLVIILMAF